jgi:hypothetical protein
VSVAGTVTDTDRRRWQCQAARRLLDVLDLGQRRGLSPIGWTVASTAVLVGRCTGYPDDDLSRVWQAWTDALSAIPSPPHRSPTGVMYLRSVVPDPQYPRLARIVLLADYAPDTGRTTDGDEDSGTGAEKEVRPDEYDTARHTGPENTGPEDRADIVTGTGPGGPDLPTLFQHPAW